MKPFPKFEFAAAIGLLLFLPALAAMVTLLVCLWLWPWAGPWLFEPCPQPTQHGTWVLTGVAAAAAFRVAYQELTR